MCKAGKYRLAHINGIILNVYEIGAEGNPLIVMLHGFPDTHQTWKNQFEVLANAGYRVLAPDQRGYGSSHQERAQSDYHLDNLAQDVAALIKDAGYHSAAVVGHDWGAAVAWLTAARFPEIISQLVVINGPNPHAMMLAMLSNPKQFYRTWYLLGFQLPWLPERLLRWSNFKLLVRALRKNSLPNTFPEAHIDSYRQVWSQPGALKGIVDWHRATVRRPPWKPSRYQVAVPTLILWGVHDSFLVRQLATKSARHCTKGEVCFLENAGHWPHLEDSEQANEKICEFLNKNNRRA